VPASLAVLEVDDEPSAPGATAVAVRTELDAVEQAGSSLGVLALALAARVDRPGRESGPALAALTRELRATLAEAWASGRHSASIAERLGDELAQRRARRGSR